MTRDIDRTDEEWRQMLSPEQFEVVRLKGTEPAFSGKYYMHKADGSYMCVGCGSELFESSAKYDSGSGWPSFWEPADGASIDAEPDSSHGMRRTEVLCAKCGAHLGHLFDDGPKPGGRRYCVNSAALVFEAGARGTASGGPDADETE